MSRSQQDLIIRELNGLTERSVSAIGLEVVANLREDTPRDTGWARANWIGSKGRPVDTPAETSGKPTPGDVASARAASAEGEAQIASYRLTDGLLYISNNVPYVPQLNAGSSKQAGEAFIERSIERGVGDALRAMARRSRR